jgi:hypothetical protein
MNSMIEVLPIEVDGKTVKYLDIIVVMVRLKGPKIIAYTLVDADMKMIKGVNMVITEEEYNGWTNNDDYITELTLSKTGLTKVS